MGTGAAVQIQGSHRLTKKHRGQGLRNRESHDATVLTLLTSCCPADGEQQMEREMRRERKAGSPSSRDPSEGSFSSMLGLQRPLCVAVRQAAPSSHSGEPLHGARIEFPLRPRGSLKAYTHKKVSLLSRSRDDTINVSSLLCMRQICRKM